MKNHLFTCAIAFFLTLLTCRIVYAHCEIPCGIYGDRTRIDLLYEDIATIEKSMAMINELAGKSGAQDTNQLVRWIENKGVHADKIQHVVTQYFMTQRVKNNEEGGDRYLRQLTSLHQMLVAAMKCKQTVDASHCAKLRELLDYFSAAYFSAEDLKHIREHHGKKKE